jgi:hypothetical protein
MCRFEKNPIMISPHPIFEVNKLPHDEIFSFEHPAYLNSGKKRCGSIYLLSFGGNYSCVPSEIPRLEYQ